MSATSAYHIIEHANGRGTGARLEMELHPAREAMPGYMFFTIRRQLFVTNESNEFVPNVFDSDPAHEVVFKLSCSELSEVLMVFRGMRESIADGKGLFHRSVSAVKVIRFSHMIEPRPGYLLEVSKKPTGGELVTANITLTEGEALYLSLAIEASMSMLVFGVPRAAGEVANG